MQKGVLLEVEGRTGVVLTPKGEFKRVPLPHGAHELGDEIAFQESGGLRWGWLAAAAAVLLLVLTPLGYQQWQLAQPVALLMIDINPSLQLTLNSRDQVIDALGLNADGEAVLEGIAWRRRPVGEVARAIAARAVEAGKLDPAAEGSAVVVAVAPAKGEALPGEVSQALVAESRSALEAEVAAQAGDKGAPARTAVAVVAATAAEVQQAREQDLTVPRLIILEELRADHPEVTADTLRSAPPGKVLKELGVSPGELFGRAEQRHNGTGDAPAVAPRNAGDDGDDEGDAAGKPGNGRGRNNNNGNGNGNGQWKGNNGRGNGGGSLGDDEGKADDKPGNGYGRDRNNGNGKNTGDDNAGGKPGNGNGRNNNGRGNNKGSSPADEGGRSVDDGDETGNPGQGYESPGQGSSGVGDQDDDDKPGKDPGRDQNNGRGNGQGNGNNGQGNGSSGQGNGNSGQGNGSSGQGNGSSDRGNGNNGRGNGNSGQGNGNNGQGNGNSGQGNGNNGRGNGNSGRGNQ